MFFFQITVKQNKVVLIDNKTTTNCALRKKAKSYLHSAKDDELKLVSGLALATSQRSAHKKILKKKQTKKKTEQLALRVYIMRDGMLSLNIFGVVELVEYGMVSFFVKNKYKMDRFDSAQLTMLLRAH